MLLAGCTSSVEAPATCPDIGGNYKVTATRSAGTCDPKLDPGETTVAFSKAGAGYNVIITGLSGGCPGTLDASTCRFTANCEAKDEKSGATIETFSLDYTFSGASFKGTGIAAARPPAVATPCDVTYQEQGTKL